MFTGSFYQKTEQGKRTGVWFSFNGSFGVLGAFLAYGLSRADHTGKLAIPGWQVIFILLGAITVGLGIAVTLFMPNSPATAGFLSERERDVAVERLRLNHQSTIKEFSRSQMMEAFTDPMTGLYALFTALVTIPNGAITNFSSILIRGLGFSSEKALLLQAPANAIAAISIFCTLYVGDVTSKRILACINTYAVALIGAIIVWVLPRSNPIGRLLGVLL
jgi:ACS family allantoate permease-like MFS transporter